eukprot:3241042-Pyramimonas_sp.AAC.2
MPVGAERREVGGPPEVGVPPRPLRGVVDVHPLQHGGAVAGGGVGAHLVVLQHEVAGQRAQ